MNLWESARIGVRALRANLLRSILTMLGMIVGVGAVITMVAIGDGAQVQVTEQIRSLGANLLMIQPGAARDGGARLSGGTGHTLTEDDADAILSEVPYVSAAAPSARGSAQLVYGNRNWNAVVNGTTPGYFLAREWPVESGRLFTATETGQAAKVVLLGTSVAEALFGEENPVGHTIRINSVPFTVIGILRSKGPSGSGRDQDDIAFVPISTGKLRLFGGSHAVNRNAVAYILVKVARTEAMDYVQAQITGLLRQRHRIGSDELDDFGVRTPAAAMAAQREATKTLTILLGSVASVSLIVGGISIMNIMLVSITERTREIGLRLAIGARRRDIRRQFLIEALTLCVVGGLLGVICGLLATIVIADLAGWPALFGPGLVLLALGFSIMVGVFFGLYPAYKASRLDPITALRFE